MSFAFIARNKLAILESAPNGSCLRVQTAPSASSHAGHATADAGRIEPLPVATDKIFFAGPNRLILLGEDKVSPTSKSEDGMQPQLTSTDFATWWENAASSQTQDTARFVTLV